MDADKSRQIYLDYGAAAPVDPRVVEAMTPYFTEVYGNPSSVHRQGMDAGEAIDGARENLSRLIGADDPKEMIFTSGATESNNMAIRGVASRNRDRGDHVITTTIEHMSVINPCKSLQKAGFRVTYLSVDGYGMVNPEELERAITDETILISVMYANNEVGTIQPISEIGEIAGERSIPFHVDATAAAGKVPIDVEKDGIDLMTLSSNDLYGPKGVGALYMKKGVKIEPIIYGGGQEKGLRSGTENVAGIVGMGKAADITGYEMRDETEKLSRMRDWFTGDILSKIKASYLNGHPTKRLPNNINIRFSYIEGESILLNLEMEGIAASTSSACTSKTLESSHVLRAMGIPEEEAHGALLLTPGRWNVMEDVKKLSEVLPDIVKRLRLMSPLAPKEVL